MINVLLYHILAYTIHRKIWKCHKNNISIFKISAPTWNDTFELSDRLDFVSDIQYYFEYIIKNLGEKSHNPPRRICVKNRK